MSVTAIATLIASAVIAVVVQNLHLKKILHLQEAPQPLRKRDISDQQRNDICDALTELNKDKFKHHCPLEVHGFSDELAQKLVNNCSTKFTISDILKFPLFSVRTALQILEAFQDIFL